MTKRLGLSQQKIYEKSQKNSVYNLAKSNCKTLLIELTAIMTDQYHRSNSTSSCRDDSVLPYSSNELFNILHSISLFIQLILPTNFFHSQSYFNSFSHIYFNCLQQFYQGYFILKDQKMSSNYISRDYHLSEPEEQLRQLSFFDNQVHQNASFYDTRKSFYQEQPTLGSWQKSTTHEFYQHKSVKTPQIRIRNSMDNLNKKNRKQILILDPQLEKARNYKIKQTKSKYLNFIGKNSSTSTSTCPSENRELSILQNLQKLRNQTKRILENTPIKKQHTFFVQDAPQKKISFISYPIASTVLRRRNYRKLDANLCPSLMLRFKN